MSRSGLPLLWICGPSGVGKSSVGWELFTQIRATGIKAGYIDSDQMGFCRPEPAGDPRNDRLRSRNLGAMLSNFRDAGARCMVASGLLETPAAVEMFRAAVPDARFVVCRLRAQPATLRERIFLRGSGGGPQLPGDQALTGASAARLLEVVEHSVAVAAAMERDEIGDFSVDTDDRSIREVAGSIVQRAREQRLFVVPPPPP
jgi:hypothetical protein